MPTTEHLEKLRSLELPYFMKPAPDGSPRIALYLDNHLLDTHNQCEAKFYFRHVRRIRPKGMGGFALNIGAWWSDVLEWLYNSIRQYQHNTISHYPTKEEFVIAAGALWNKRGMGGLMQSKPTTYSQFGGEAGAIAMAGQYYLQQGQMDCANWRIIAAEKAFGARGEILLYEDSDLMIYWLGKPDLVVLADRATRLEPVEHKTVERIDRNIQVKYKPHPQTAGYIFALRHLAKELNYDGPPVDRCIVNVASRMPPAAKPRDGVHKPRFTRVYPNYSLEELEEWRFNVVKKAKRLYESLLTDEWMWKESSCHLYGGCEYRTIHSKPLGTREIAIASDYVQVEPWSPSPDDEESE